MIEFLGAFWHDFLYQPLFNLLIWLYNNWTDQNFGWAVVLVTVFLRILLIPFTLITERDKVRNAELAGEVVRINKEFHNDAVLRKDEIRRVLKKRRVRPWAKIVVIGVQLLVLVLLYQVFLRGITNDKIVHILYPFIDFPGRINTLFYGFDLNMTHEFIWAGAVALFIFVEVYMEFKDQKAPLRKADLLYFVAFPLAVFFLLWILPMVKSLFVLTSMLFSVIINWFSKPLFGSKKSKAGAAHGH